MPFGIEKASQKERAETRLILISKLIPGVARCALTPGYFISRLQREEFP